MPIGGQPTMRAFYGCEVTYPFVAQQVLDATDSVRASLPNKYCDPKIAANLYHETLDEYLVADDVGLNVMATEHHAGINSLIGSNPTFVGIIARQTRKARILSLGTLISLRRDPVRIAEEYAMIDVISRGRLEIGLVKSGGSEMASNNGNPMQNEDRLWEGIDLISKALTHREGPFSWEGKYFTHRHVNIWPGPYQQPMPRLWAATGDPRSTAECGRRGIINTLVLRGPEGTKKAWDAYKRARREAGLPPATHDMFGYAAMVYVGDTDEEGMHIGSKILWFLNTSLKTAPQMSKFLPGAAPPEAAPQIYRSKPKEGEIGGAKKASSDLPRGDKDVTKSASQNAAALMSITAEQAIAQGILFAGNPDTVFRQIIDFQRKAGPFGNLNIIGRSGFLTHAEAVKGIKMFAREVLPRLDEGKAEVHQVA
jgi:alkanesulfonate monooxygenase SsuD/methylene tetrahydromethanopterin reductase-like flavin-dependent oxidoreductase (luciferase family)